MTKMLRTIVLSVLALQLVALTTGAVTKVHPETSLDLMVEAVHDGDTFSTHLGGLADKVRLLGVDAPELGQLYWGIASRDKLAKLILGKHVRAEVDEVKPRDAYGRILAYVYLNTFVPGKELMVQRELLASGMVTAKAYGKAPRMFSALLAFEAEAKARKTGIWSDPTFILPDIFRHSHGVGR